MKTIYPLNTDGSLKENIRTILPLMLDEFMRFAETVTTFPLRKNDLHQMRIAGKPLRYAMEIGEYAFGGEFKKCLGEFKNTLELMGEIHDADVMMPELNLHIKEIRLFNQTIPDFKQRFSTRTLRDSVAELRDSRKKMYEELCNNLNNWQRSDFKLKLTSSMNS